MLFAVFPGARVIQTHHKINVNGSPGKLTAEIESPTGMNNDAFNFATALDQNDAGLFYRVELPYLVTISRDSGVAVPDAQPNPTPVLWIPNESPIGFAAVRRSVFGDKTTTMSFSDGSLTKYEADYTGDVLSIVKLPITVIGAVSSAIGEVATARKANVQAEIDLLDKARELENARIRYERCSAALAAKQDAQIDEYCN